MTVGVHIYGISCRGCSYQAVIEDEDDESVTRLIAVPLSDMQCPQCSGSALSYILLPSLESKTDMLPAEAIRQAFLGLGSPVEQMVDPSRVRELFVSGVSDVELALSPTGRVLVHKIHFSGGSVGHLAASGFGAALFKITGG